MVTILDIGPLLELKTRLSRGAFFSGLTIYLEGIVILVLATEEIVAPAVAIVATPLLIVQAIVIRRPARQLIDGSLVRAYQNHLVLAAVVVGTICVGANGSEGRLTALFMGLLVVAWPSWPVLTTARTARQLREPLARALDTRVLMTCLSFDPRQAIADRRRALGGQRTRWTEPIVAAAVALVGTLVALALLLRMLGVRPSGVIGQVAAIVALWVFYRRLRHVKLRATALRAHDTRPPVLVLRQFADDALGSGRLQTTGTFEHVIAAELGRQGPTISIGKPGERLQPLGASRDYVTGEDWRTSVDALLRQAGLAVLILGSSDSLMWELKTAIARCGLRNILILVPPMLTRGDLERRWTSFVAATIETHPVALPAALPAGRTLAIMFAGDDPVLVVNRTGARRRWTADRSWREYRLIARLRECLGPDDLASVADFERFVARALPIVRVLRGEPAMR